MEKDKREKHFVLVHGGCHGAWCWYKVATLLKSGGHKVTVLDLAASGIHPKQVHEVLSYFDYFEPLMEFMKSLPPEERVILVGHSMGGFSISASMERFLENVSVAVFCTAFMPSPDLSSTTILEQYTRRLDSYMDSVYTFDNAPNNRPTSLLLGPNLMSSKLYQLSPPEVAILLKTAGHRVTALDMSASGTHPSQLYEVPSISDYFKPLTEFMVSLPLEERVILVGHSMGGYCISTAMEIFPEKVSVAVFCTAFMPSHEFSYTYDIIRRGLSVY
ncbi:hypothetical protein QYF36_015523 [Acer negundo]|nr:hypothetical protein QYF36_015523 [Acer negundo]